jgi:catechol 2,3-dioxygenase-like lactoylglutathione lyase family enzyme
MGHRDPRMTLRVYTDVTGMKPQTRMAGLLGDADWALSGTGGPNGPDAPPAESYLEGDETRQLAAVSPSGSDGTRTRGLRRDRPAL